MPKVLLIDDDPTVVAMYDKLFRRHGYEVASAGDGASGLESFHRERPDLVLLDLGLPGMSGLQWLQTVRRQPGLDKLPVVVLTAGGTKAQVLSALSVGASCVLLKARDQPQRVIDVAQTLISGEGPKTWG